MEKKKENGIFVEGIDMEAEEKALKEIQEAAKEDQE